MPAFQKGQSGNPAGRKKGVPTKVHREVRDLARRILDRDYWQLKYQRLHDGTEHPKIAALLLEYAFGAPPKEIRSSGVVVHLGPLEALRTRKGDDTIGAKDNIVGGAIETDTVQRMFTLLEAPNGQTKKPS
jgi:hypothetical protein